MFDDDPDRAFRVVINAEEQYSLWPADRELPAGWQEEGKRGAKDECLAHIEQVWTDMRPRSLRVALGETK
ncbi:MAG: MbtH family protein [Micromonosporaceae bacterium]